MIDGKLKEIAEEQRELSSERLRNWCIWKVVLPLGMLALFYPMYRFVLELEHPFERAFAHGDLILFSVLILLEAAVEGEHIRKQGAWFHLRLHLAKVAAILLILIFGFVKTDVMLQESKIGDISSHADVFRKFLVYSYFNWLVALVAVIYSLFSFWTVVGKEHSERLENIARVNTASTS